MKLIKQSYASRQVVTVPHCGTAKPFQVLARNELLSDFPYKEGYAIRLYLKDILSVLQNQTSSNFPSIRSSCVIKMSYRVA